MSADSVLDPAERAHVQEAFGGEVLRACGFQDPDGRWTAAFEEARDLALLELPDRLATAEKLAVLEMLVDASAADGLLEPAEVDVLAAAARMLRLGDDEWTAYVEALLSSGRMQRAE